MNLSDRLMKKADLATLRKYLVGQLALSVIAAFLLLFDDFSGYYYGDYYLGVEQWGYIYMGSGIFSSIIILLLAGCFLLSIYLTVKLLRQKNVVSVEGVTEAANKTIKAGTFSAVLASVSAMIFIAFMILDEANDWWLDAGFYGALIGGLFLILFGKLVLEKVKNQ